MDSNNKQIKYSHYQITDSVKFGGLMDPEKCKVLAKKILNLYDGDGNGYVDSFEVGYMQSDCYRAMNKGFNPTPTDIAAYSRVLDRKGTGRIHFDDIEALCLKYFGGEFTAPPPPEPKVEVQSSYRQTTSASQYLQSIRGNADNQPSPSLTPKAEQPKPVQVQAPSTGKYSKQVQDRLEVARRIFRMLDTEKRGFITEVQVPLLLIETYKQMGMDYSPSQEDVDLWMEMADLDRDGKVYLEDYETLVLNSLKQQGIVLE